MPSQLVAAYCRISTLEQKKKGYGLEIQVRDATLFAQNQRLFIDRFYKDKGRSGTDERRPGLRRLLKDCRQGLIQSVIIPSLDRLSRDVRLAENLFWTFERLGVRVLIADMPTYDRNNRRDVLIRQIREAIAEENRKDIIERLWKGRQERVRRGQPPGGNVPYGYQRSGKMLVPHPEEATIVRRIFARPSREETSTAIVSSLNANGFRRRNGKPWTIRQVQLILQHRELYESGIIHYGGATGRNEDLILLAY